tara:strand:+ start:4485 stop:5495 length:1011 start_codon:yes stop_codon:yes gene_type:complete
MKYIKFLFVLSCAAILFSWIPSNDIYAHGGRDVNDFNFVIGFEIEPAYEGIINAIELKITGKPPKEETHSDGHHDHDHHSHGHTDMDVKAHGAIFASEVLSSGDDFSTTISKDINNVEIPYHDHMNHDITGTIQVSNEGDAGEVKIMIHETSLMPPNIHIQPGTTIIWVNHSQELHAITSGVMTSNNIEKQPISGLSETLKTELIHVSSQSSIILNLSEDADNPGRYTSPFIPTSPGVYEIRVYGTIHGTQIDETFVSMGGGGDFDDIIPPTAIQFPQKLTSDREITGAITEATKTSQLALMRSDTINTWVLISFIIGAVGIVISCLSLALQFRKK